LNEARIVLLKKYIEEEPDDPFNYYALANELIGQYPVKAKEYFDLLLSKHPDYLATYYHAALLYVEEEDYETAEPIYKKGIALATKHGNHKALRELNTAYQNMLFEMD